MPQFVSDCFAWAIQRLAFDPPRFPGYREHEAEYVKTIDGLRIATLLVRPGREDLVDAGPPVRDLILYSHGNAEDIGSCRARCQWLADGLDCDVLVYDYVNYGHSSASTMTEERMYAAILAVYEYASRQPAHASRRLFIMGRSLGTTASTRLARVLSDQSQPDGARLFCGLILELPLASGFRVLCDGERLPATVAAALDRVFCPLILDIPLVTQPVFVIHGQQDLVINISNARLIQEHVRPLSSYPPLFVDAGHNDVEECAGTLLLRGIRRFQAFCQTGCAVPP